MEGGLVGWMIDTLREMSGTTAFFSLFGVLGLCGLGLPVPEDIILITAGFLAALGKFPLWLAILMGMVGVLSGDAVLFFLGRRYGLDVYRLPVIRRVFTEDRLAMAQARVRENERFICFVARFLPGLRSPIYLTAGAMGVPPRVYIMQDGIAASISVPFWVVVGWYFGGEIEQALLWAKGAQGWFLGGVVALVAGYVLFKWQMARRAARKVVPVEDPPDKLKLPPKDD